MRPKNEEKARQRLEDVLAFAQERLSGEVWSKVEPFLSHYYLLDDAEGVLLRSVADLYGAAMAHWQFAQKFVTGQARIRVYNPNLEQHGWYSDHTVVEIVNDDMPFLIDSVTMEVNRLGLALHSATHPVFWVDRDGQQIEQVRSGSAKDSQDAGTAKLESYTHIEVDRCTEPAKLEELQVCLARILSDVRVAVEDWPAIRERARETIAELAARTSGSEAQAADLAEARSFIEWMEEGNFTFLGFRDYLLIDGDSGYKLQGVHDSGLGILRETRRTPGEPDTTILQPGSARIIESHLTILLTKANSRATVHRPGYLDYVGVKLLDADGRVAGERRFLGLYTSTAYMISALEIPIVRRKVTNVLARAGFLSKGHSYKALLTILEQYPREELFQIDEDELVEIALGILHLQERQRTRLFVRRDSFDRFVSCMVFVPRDKFNTDLRERIQKILLEAFNGVIAEFTPLLSESLLARIHIVVRTRSGGMPQVDVRELEARIVQATRRWQDDLADALIGAHGEEQGNRLLRRYGGSFPASFIEDYPARTAVRDIELMERIQDGAGLAMNLYRPIEAGPAMLRFKVYRSGAPIALSSSLPMLEHLGVNVDEERSYLIESESGVSIWVHDFGMEVADGTEIDIERIKGLFEDAFARVWQGEVENNDLNRLVLRAQLTWREVSIVRAYAKYVRQVGSPFSDAYVERALTGNPAIARMLVDLFVARFDLTLGAERETHITQAQAAVNAALDKVPNLDEDRILRQFLGVINATTRTNYFQRAADGGPKSYISFKFNPALVPNLPEPRPMFEIWVYSPRVEGVHLRGGRVARGGLRWSDRREDFRTEVLGLVKAQMVKNTVIVPVGSKGGFVVKNPPPMSDRDAYLKEGVACYQIFLRGLLDVTDNFIGGKIVPPVDVVRHDTDDPYLVVAADKGTATFSDYANAISAEYGFWLADAFASGGSVGYDHKKMAITARGAWESVKRHFREMDIDTQNTPFTVVGVGDMSGDVFGNGMLLSRHIRLIAAFDHRHIFLDPNPDEASSFAERERLYQLPRSSWADYSTGLISAGGGIYARSAKTIPLSAEVQSVLQVSAAELAPNDLIRAILKAPVDLLYNGGIGTYVKASSETHAQVGDRASDAVRVNGVELRCNVVAEGGNLGLTQLGRIEFAQHGGRINTDAIDNSAGVDCSDHEVNIKILLGLVVSAGEMTEKQRNKLLAEMTDEVGELVLHDNYYQTQALSTAARRNGDMLESEARLVRFLEKAGRLNRLIEFLPSDEEIHERRAAKRGLTTPERAVLLAYSKMWLYDQLLSSALPEDPFVVATLPVYFPQPLRLRYSEAMHAHPLKREIIATHLTNTLVNRVGCTFVHRLSSETGVPPADVVRAVIIARDVFGLLDVWSDIDKLDNQLQDALQAQMFGEVGELLERATLWFLHRGSEFAEIETTVARFKAEVERLVPQVSNLLAPEDARALSTRQETLAQSGATPNLALRVAGAPVIAAVLDIAEVAAICERSLELVAGVYFMLDMHLHYSWISARVSALPVDTHWQMLARTAAFDDLTALRRALTISVLRLSATLDTPDTLIEAWRADFHTPLEYYLHLIADQQSASSVDLSMLSVLLREMRKLGGDSTGA